VTVSRALVLSSLLVSSSLPREAGAQGAALGPYALPARYGLGQTGQAQAPDSVTAWDAAHASPTVTICLRSLGVPTAIAREALHRIEAELSASGFLVDQADGDASAACAEGDPSIRLRSSQSAVDITASAGPGDDPVLQTVSTKDNATTAELIAIRAVEGLRAAMMQALRRSPDAADNAPETVRRFTRQDEPQPTPPEIEEPPPQPPPEPLPPDPAEEARPAPGQRTPGATPDLLLTLGGAMAWDGANPGFDAVLGVSWLLRPVALGIGIDAGIVPGSWNAMAGSVELRPFGLTGTLAALLPCGPKWECHLGAAAGLRQFSMSATSAPSGGVPITVQENHASAVLTLDGLVGYFPAPRFGFFLRGQAGLLLDAPALEVGAESLQWGRPSLGLSLGLATRF